MIDCHCEEEEEPEEPNGTGVCDEVTFYEKCGWKGKTFVGDEHECLEFTPKSVCVPEKSFITVYNMCGHEG